ncbi:hypothetical protein NDU88_004905 [Pleurodeles waltl]|uniref:Uncharacterized protein n=1 Tax=Pleurodeles waltl TaxID=8319 RepID=A0AAV7RM98_PLEWA|nr:hypothetical protein NDU88_004905 [Pleurodeles waltl]
MACSCKAAKPVEEGVSPLGLELWFSAVRLMGGELLPLFLTVLNMPANPRRRRPTCGPCIAAHYGRGPGGRDISLDLTHKQASLGEISRTLAPLVGTQLRVKS